MLSTEQQVANLLKSVLFENDIIYIDGEHGCGKEYTVCSCLNEIYNNNYLTFRMPTYPQSHIEYLPFKDAFAQEPASALGLKELVAEGSEFVAKNSDSKLSLLGFLSNLLVKSSVSKQTTVLSIFDDAEIDIISKLHNVIRKRNIQIFTFFNIYDWDDKSTFLLVRLLQYKNQIKCLKNVKFIITNQSGESDFLSAIASRNISILHFQKLDTSFENQKCVFNEILNRDLSIEIYNQLQPIIKICDNDFDLLKLMVNDVFNSENIKSDNDFKGISALLEYKLKSMGAEQTHIESILKYASVLGMYFTIYELENILEKSKIEFIHFVENAQQLYLINASDKNENSYSFAHEFIQKIMELSISGNDLYIYDKAQKMISKLYPYDYVRRARYCVKIKDNKTAKMLFTLYWFQSIRNSRNLPFTIKKEAKRLFDECLDGETWKNCIELYEQGVELYNQGKFESAVAKFKSISKILPKEILCEIDIMKTLCMTKSLDIDSRKNAVAILEDDLNDDKDCCISVMERIRVRLIILYAHLNMTEAANRTEDDLFLSLKERISYDTKAHEIVALLERISNSHYSCEIACNKMKNAVKYFGPSDNCFPINIAQYFNALTNYSGALCMCGEFNKSFEIAKKAINLREQFVEVNYPREYFVLNNYILSGFLSGNFSAEECVKKYTELMKKVPDSADRLLFCSNQAVFYSLVNKQEKAIDILSKAAIKYNVSDDPEKIYNYRYVTNMSVFYYLSGDIDNAKKTLSQCPNIDKTIPDSQYMDSKLKMLEQLYEQGKCELNPIELLYCFNNQSANTTPTKYYHLAYTFTTQYNWDID